MQTSFSLRPLRAAFAFGLSVFALTATAAEPGVTDTKVVLGSVTPVSGPPSLLGKAHMLALKVWEQDVNARGGINGRKVEIRQDDDGYVPERALQGIKRLNEVENIFALLGTSGAAMMQAMLPYIEEQKIPTINGMAVSASHFTPPRKTVFILGPTEGLKLVESLDDVGAVIVDAKNNVWVSERLRGKIQLVAAPSEGI